MDFIQYTIDGNKEIHDERRLIEGGSYNKILRNIKYNSDKMGMSTIIRVNIDKKNKEHMDEMLKDIKELEINNLTFDFAARFETPCDSYDGNKDVLTHEEFANAIKDCLGKVDKLNLLHSRRYANDTPCLAIVPRQFVIDPMGKLYKCAAFAGEKHYEVGSIYETDMNERYVDMVGIDAWHECKNCKYVPLCGGGCLFLNKNQFSNYKKRVCQYKLFDELTMEILASTLDKESILKAIQNI